ESSALPLRGGAPRVHRPRSKGMPAVHRLLRRAIVRFVLVIALAIAAEARAQPEQAMERVLLQAAGFASEGDHAAGIALLRRARELGANERIDLSLATSLAETGELTEARALLVNLATRANPLLAEVAREQLVDVEGRLASLTLHLRTSSTDGL